MIVKNVPVTLLKVDNKKGVGKESGQPYDFFVMNVVDEEANVFKLNISDEAVSKSGSAVLLAPEFRNVPVSLDIRFSPKGFDIAGTVQEFEVLEKE